MATATRRLISLSGRPRGEPSPGEVLAKLIEEQAEEIAAEEASPVLRPQSARGRRILRESEVAESGRRRRGGSEADWSLDQLPERRAIPWTFDTMLVGLDQPWEAMIHDAVRAGACLCPGCEGRPLRFREACVICDRLGAEEAGFELPGIKDVLNPDADRLWPIATKYRGHGRLAGGKGRQARQAAR